MDMNIETLKHLVDYGVIALLVFMSFIAVYFFIERVIFYKKILSYLSSCALKWLIDVFDFTKLNTTSLAYIISFSCSW